MKKRNGSNVLVTLGSIYESLSIAEKKVADAVLSDKESAVYASVTDLAEIAGTGETTVIRFCRKLGFRGYQEFKLSMAQVLVSPAEQVHGRIEETDSLTVITNKISSSNIQALKNTSSLLMENELEKAAEALARANKIYFFGVGSSGITAQDANYRFMRLGFNVNCASDAHIIAMNSALVCKDDVVMCISTSGSTKDLVDALRIAKKNGAYMICLTNHARSPVTQLADAVLLCQSRENPLQGGAFSSKLAQIHVLDIVSTIVALKRKDDSFASIEKTARSVTSKLY